MDDQHTPPRIDPLYPSSADVTDVPCNNPTKHGENEAKGYVGHKGHVGRSAALLAGLFGTDDALTPDPPEPVTPATTPDRPADAADADPLPTGGLLCQFCGSANLIDSDEPPGIRCDACGHLTWIDDGASLVRVAWHGHDIASMAPDDLPTCHRCGDLCDTQTLDDRWHCSPCGPDEAAARRERTRRFLSAVAGVLRYTQPCNG